VCGAIVTPMEGAYGNHDGDQNVLDATIPELVHHAQPEFGAFRGLDPKAQDVLGSFRRDAQRDIDGLVAIARCRRLSGPGSRRR
jgi:hypothetical protein